MARKSLRPYMNQIRAWTRQGRTDAWVAHQLEVSVQDVEDFKRQSGLTDVEQAGGMDVEEEIDLRAADEALIAAELEAAQLASTQAADEEQAQEGRTGTRTRRRSRRGGSGRRGGARQGGPMEGTFDHGEEGYGLWLDPAIRDDPVYAEYWAGHRPVEVSVEEDQIVIRRAGDEGAHGVTEEDDADPADVA
ncbi:MAG: hypothetical protein ACYDA6_01305 [Solirubrobacteraceae bacterium]